MKLSVLPLETRDAPATDVGLGEVLVAPGVYRHAFEDSWTGHLNLHDTGELVYVGAGPGGGPRVQVYDKAGNLLKDFFAGDTTSRAGVYFVPTDPATREVIREVVRELPVHVPVPYPVEVVREVEVPAEVPAVTVGDLDSEDPFVVYVDWERPPGLDWVTKGMARLAADLPVEDLVFTTVRPNLPPDQYGVAVVGADLSHRTDGAAGVAYARWDVGLPNAARVMPVLAGYAHTTEDLVGDLLAHEIAHGFGWQHGDDGDFRDNLDVVAHGVQLAKNF